MEEENFDQQLQSAACDGDYEAVVDLVENKGCNPSGFDFWQKPLALAASSGHVQVVDYLLQHGADVNGTDLNGDSALMSAVCHLGTLQIVQMLLENGADVNHRDAQNKSVLEWATERSSQEIIDFLTAQINAPQGA